MIHEQRAELSYVAYMLVPCCCCAPARPPTQQRAGLRCGRGCGVGGAVSSLVGGRTDRTTHGELELESNLSQ